MMIQEPLKKKESLPIVKCKLCHNDVKLDTKIVKLGGEYGIICGECARQFSNQEIELMYNMFTAFGGHFGMLKNTTTSTYKLITQLIEEYNLQEKRLKATEVDVKILHKALLYGITPRQLIQGVKLLND